MVKQANYHGQVSVKLEDDILVNTTLPQQQHAALRAGFVGYPVNPRWSVDKYCAWKIGCQLRNDLQQGKLVVRQSDFCLIPAEAETKPHHNPLDGLVRPLVTWTRTILTVLPTTS